MLSVIEATTFHCESSEYSMSVLIFSLIVSFNIPYVLHLSKNKAIEEKEAASVAGYKS